MEIIREGVASSPTLGFSRKSGFNPFRRSVAKTVTCATREYGWPGSIPDMGRKLVIYDRDIVVQIVDLHCRNKGVEFEMRLCLLLVASGIE